MVANLAYLRQVTRDPGANVLFVRTHGDPAVVAAHIRADSAGAGLVVKDLTAQTAQTVSSITTVDLRGISGIEEVFALLLTIAAMSLYLSVALAERRQEFATMAAIGAPLRRIGAFLWSEAALVLAASLALAALLGWLLAELLVAMLQHVFDPPPDHLAVPWLFLGGLAGAAAAGALLAAAGCAIAIRRLPLGAILREE